MKRLVLLFALLIPVTALGAGPAKAGTPSGPSPAQEVEKLRHEIAVLKLDRLLDLSREQARTLLPLLKEAQALREQARAERESHRPELVRALTLVRDDLAKNGTVSEASQKALESVQASVKKTRQKMHGLLEQVREVLTADQKARLKGFNPHVLEDADGKVERDEPHKGDHAGQGHGARGRGGLLRMVASPEFVGRVEARAR